MLQKNNMTCIWNWMDNVSMLAQYMQITTK